MDRVTTIDRDCIIEASGGYDAEVTHGIQANWSPYIFPRSVTFKLRPSGEVRIIFSYIDRESRVQRASVTPTCIVTFGAESGRIIGLETHLPTSILDGSRGGQEISERIRQLISPAIDQVASSQPRSRANAELIRLVMRVLCSAQHADAFEMDSNEVSVNDLHAD